MPASESPRDFASTHWSLVLQAGRRVSPASEAALAELCQAYWQPLYSYARRRTADAHEAQDLTQSFFAHLLEKNYLASANPDRGRFRAFLLTAFQHFLAKEWERARAQKRGGGLNRLSFDFAEGESRINAAPQAELTPEQLYNRQWAQSLLTQVLDRLKQELADECKSEQFSRLQPFLGGDADQSYAEAAAASGMTEAAFKMAVHRLRRRYRQLMRESIAHTVADSAEIDDEIRSLFEAFAR
jgi:RNA polymerase sigma-70 factor (ECF subfamily)